MGIYDRDYIRTRTSRGGFGEMRMWSITTWLIVINIAVYLLDLLCSHQISELGYFSMTTAISEWQLWRFITFQFLHASPSHILFNMIGLYFFGPIVESYLGSRKYLVFYLISGIGGGLGYIALSLLGFLHDGPDTPLVGASAGIIGVIVGAARIAPDVRVMLLFPPIPLQLRTLAWICVGIAVYTVLTSGANAGGEAAHLGGALVGFLLIENQRLLNFADLRRRSRMRYRDWRNDMNR
jgi:membrane associated rhomboid family serine protease